MFITKKVFDPGLQGKAVLLSGKLVNGKIVLIIGVTDKSLRVVDGKSNISEYSINEFEKRELAITPLVPQYNTEDEKPQPKRKRKRTSRTDEQARADKVRVMNILSDNVEPMRLEEIIKNMVSKGHIHWDNKNATGFMYQMMNEGAPISKVKRGYYVIDWNKGEAE